MRLVGHPEYIDEPWFAKGSERAKHADELDEAVGAWISDRTQEEVVAAFEEAGAAVAPIYDIEGIMQDPQYEALNSIITVDDPELGPTKMQNVLFRLSETPGEVEMVRLHPGRAQRRGLRRARHRQARTGRTLREGHPVKPPARFGAISTCLVTTGEGSRRPSRARPTPSSSTWKMPSPRTARRRPARRSPAFSSRSQRSRSSSGLTRWEPSSRQRTSTRWRYATSPGCGCRRPNRWRA